MNDKPRFKSKADRELMALALAMDPTMKDAVRKLFRMGVRNIRHDRILFSNPGGSPFEVPDPGELQDRKSVV